MLKNQYSNISRENITAGLVLLLAVFVSFGLLIPWLGFYWDDWPVIYLKQTQGIQAYWDFYQYDRPFSAWTYIVFTPILGTSPFVWQIFTLLLRWLTAVFVWASLKLIWPNKSREVFWVAVLFAVCPIFLQQAVAVAYSQHWICYLLYFLSIYWMLRAQEQPQRFYLFTALALVASLVQLLTMEYFLGLEIFRPVILWFYFRERAPALSIRPLLRKVISTGWIYLALLMAYIIWRMFFLQLAGDDPNQLLFLESLRGSPLLALVDLGQKIIQDFVYLITAWIAGVKPGLFELQRPFSLVSIAVAVSSAILFWFLLRRHATDADSAEIGNAWHKDAMIFGVLAILFGTLPVWLIERQISVGPLGPRFSLAAIFGVSILLVGFLEWLSPRSRSKLAVVCMLIGVAIHTNLHTYNIYQYSWEKQRAFFWQLYWRAPYIEPGTAFISEGEVFPYVGLYSTAMGISSLYPPVEDPQQMPYWFFSYSERLYRIPKELVAGTALEDELRNYTFQGDSRNAILLDFYPEEKRCLKLLSLHDSDDKDLPDSIAALLRISNFERIHTKSPDGWTPPVSVFGTEPEHTWCYYFEKADLAYQEGDWENVITLMDEAKRQGFMPSDMKEYLPLLAAYLQTGDIESALDLSIQIKRISAKVDDRVCKAWVDAAELNQTTEYSNALEKIRDRYRCFD